MTTVRDATIKLLRAFGMNMIFGNPGSTELPMFRNFPADFRYILGLQESVVLGMADGYAQATRNAALVNLHSSAGMGHALGNLFTAFKNQTPLVVTAGQQARSILPYEPFLFADRPTEFPRPFVKWACEPARAQDVPAAIARAYYVAMEPPCGPTFVSVPVDDWDQPCDPIEPRRIAAINPGDPVMLAEAAEALAAASRPAFVVGAGVARDDGWDEVIALAERHTAAVWVAPMSARNSFPEDHPLFAGFLMAGREAIVKSLTGHDLILVLGGPMSLYHVEGFGPHVPEGAKVIQIVDNHAQAAWSPTGTAIIAHARLALRTLMAGPSPVSRAMPKARAPVPELDGRVMTSAYLLQQIARHRPAGSVIVEEAPSSRGAMHDHLPIIDRDGFYTCASGGLGHGLPAAIGVALARPTDKIIAVLGDGSSMYAIQGLWSAAQLGLPISFVVVKNGRYEALNSFGRIFGLQETVGTQLPDIDFCALARGQGIKARRAMNAQELDEALTASFSASSPTLVEAVVD
ncbi:benzoylformate decarboxylase [Sphingobium sp. Leaf26]|uniref:benzoylformate decarboxylase n=1 Tax=Sphingobium sp. Leaf26 TaxID=1735693 RepID=UPI0006FD73F4|nr:benzoylformate decarboxylase [Sphingobium sp. Leaf26]KQN08594.1 benzoylformate decarboxylase [Sphingobium sp. Leaf26]